MGLEYAVKICIGNLEGVKRPPESHTPKTSGERELYDELMAGRNGARNADSLAGCIELRAVSDDVPLPYLFETC